MYVDFPFNLILTLHEFVRQGFLRKRPEDRLKLLYYSTDSCGKVRLAMNMVLRFKKLCL
jgi:hypothetical protein